MTGDPTDKKTTVSDRGVANRGLTGSVPVWGPEVFRFVRPDGSSYSLSFKGGTEPAQQTAQVWADYFGHKLLVEHPRSTQERKLSPPPLVQAQPDEPPLSPPPLVQAVPPKPKPKPKPAPTKANQQTVDFDEGTEITGYRLPKTAPAPKTWEEGKISRGVKNLLLVPSKLPYGSFELRGPEPPSRDPKEAVAYWLALHKAEIVQAEKDWRVSRIAIAGIIAWEALRNPQVSSYKAVGPGKMHLLGEPGQLSWPDVIEGSGRMKPLRDQLTRRVELAKPAVAINYIGAALDVMATIAEEYGWNIRNNLEILGQVYHGSTAEEWDRFLKTKPATADFLTVRGMIGNWTEDNRKYLETAVGVPDYQ